MEDLKRLVNIISKRKQRQYPLLDLKNVSENSSKENIFFRYIKKGLVNTDDEVSDLLYGTKSEDDRYRMLKSRLKQKLLNHVFFLDFTDNNQKASNQYEQECIQQLHQAKMLLFSGENKIARSLVLKALTTAERCEFTKHQISCLEELVLIYSENHQPHLFDDVVKKLRKARVLYAKEEEAREQFYYIRMMVVKSVNSRKKNLGNTEQSILQLEKLWRETKSFNVFAYLYRLELLYKELTGEFKEIIPALKEIEADKYNGIALNKYRLNKKQVMLPMARAYFRSWEFEQCIDYIENNAANFNESLSEWFALYETYFLSTVYQKKYNDALEIIDRVFNNKAFAQQTDEDRDRWKLYNLYLLLVHSSSFLSANYSKVIEGVPEYHKDKEGINVATIILQFIYYLEQRNMVELIERRDELKQYMANHFKESFSYRSRTMYKLLNIVVESELDLKKIQFKSRYLLKKLNQNKIVGTAYVELEIVPYEHLWELMLKLLRNHETRDF